MSYTFISAATLILIRYLISSSKKRVEENQEGQIELKPNKFYLYSSLILVFCMGIFWIATIFYREEDMALGATFLTFFGGLGAQYCFKKYKNNRVVFDKENIQIEKNRRKKIMLTWSEINRVFYDPLGGEICLEHDQGEASFSYYLVGTQSFLEEMERQTNIRAKDLNLPEL